MQVIMHILVLLILKFSLPRHFHHIITPTSIYHSKTNFVYYSKNNNYTANSFTYSVIKFSAVSHVIFEN